MSFGGGAGGKGGGVAKKKNTPRGCFPKFSFRTKGGGGLFGWGGSLFFFFSRGGGNGHIRGKIFGGKSFVFTAKKKITQTGGTLPGGVRFSGGGAEGGGPRRGNALFQSF